MDEVDERDILRRFKNNEFDFLVAVRKLDEGIDIPNLTLYIDLNRATGPRQFLQRMGRILRLMEGKEEVDFVTAIEMGEDRLEDMLELVEALLDDALKSVQETALKTERGTIVTSGVENLSLPLNQQAYIQELMDLKQRIAEKVKRFWRVGDNAQVPSDTPTKISRRPRPRPRHVDDSAIKENILWLNNFIEKNNRLPDSLLDSEEDVLHFNKLVTSTHYSGEISHFNLLSLRGRTLWEAQAKLWRRNAIENAVSIINGFVSREHALPQHSGQKAGEETAFLFWMRWSFVPEFLDALGPEAQRLRRESFKKVAPLASLLKKNPDAILVDEFVKAKGRLPGRFGTGMPSRPVDVAERPAFNALNKSWRDPVFFSQLSPETQDIFGEWQFPKIIAELQKFVADMKRLPSVEGKMADERDFAALIESYKKNEKFVGLLERAFRFKE